MITTIVNLVTTITTIIEVALVAYLVTTLCSIHHYNSIMRMKQAKTRPWQRLHHIHLTTTMVDSITTRCPIRLWLTLGLLLIPNQQAYLLIPPPPLLLLLIPLMTTTIAAQTCLTLCLPLLLLQEPVAQALLHLLLGSLQKLLPLLYSNKKIKKMSWSTRRENHPFPSSQAQSREDHLYSLLLHLAFVQQEELKLSIQPKTKHSISPHHHLYSIIHNIQSHKMHTQFYFFFFFVFFISKTAL